MNDGMRTILQVIKCTGFRRAVGVMTLIILALPEKKRWIGGSYCGGGFTANDQFIFLTVNKYKKLIYHLFLKLKISFLCLKQLFQLKHI